MADSVFTIAPVDAGAPLRRNELHGRVYLHHTVLGADHNQTTVVHGRDRNGFGGTVVNDWVVTDELGPDARVVARARGVHVQAGLDAKSYYVSFNMHFQGGSFDGSTLQVMGPVVEEGEWSIVGGTGEFTLAQGVIYKRFHEQRSEGNIMELDIHAFYTPMERWQSSGEKNVWTLGV
ncbi:hypothetical protein ACP70R_019063 [Stipagrostis hirtigluma subsp. patula]